MENEKIIQSKRLIILVILFIVIAAVGLGAYLLGAKTQTPQPVQPTPLAVVQPTPTPDPTANWKTYKSKDNLYQISYPESWTVNDIGGVSIGGKNRIDISIIVESNGSEEYVKQRWQSVQCGGFSSTTDGCVPIPNKETKMLTVSGNIVYWKIDGNGQMYAFIPSVTKNKTVDIYSLDLQDKNLFDQILSTFKFTDQLPDVSSQACGGPLAVEPNNGCPTGYYCGNIVTAGGETSGRCIKK